LTLGDYVLKQMRPDLDLGVNCGDMEVIKPLIVQGDGALQTLQVSITADFDRNSANVNYSVVDSAGRQLEHHAKCIITFEDKAVWAHDWASTSYLIHSRIDTLKDRLSSGDANQVSRKLAYKLFASLVNYDVKYQGMEEVVFDSTNFEATARVNFQTNDNDHDFLVNPYWIDSVGHISGFIVNGSDATDSKNFVYISHGWSGMRLIRPLQRTSTYTTHVKMQAAPKNIMAGDVYILEGDEVVGVWKGIRFQQIPRKVLNTFLPPKGTAATVAKTLQAPVKSLPTPPKANAVASKAQSSAKPKAAAPASVKAKPAPAAAARPSPVGGYVEAIMEIIAEESSIPRAELVDASEWASLGVDSLLSLQITGRLRETMELDLPSSTFLNQPTVGEFRAFMNTMMGAERSALTSSSSSEPGSSDPGDLDSQSATSVGSVAGDDIPDVKTKTAAVTAVQGGNEVLTKIRDIISEEMNIPAEELVDSADLVSMGADSLMSICILGALREKMDLDLPSKVFQDYPTIEAIGQYLGLNKPAATAKTAKKPATGQQHRATSVFLQGNRSATKKLFLLPDGSGSATSYTHIPALDPSIAVYGLNSPYMTAPSNFTNGIPGIATVYLEELRRRQPQGPYYLGGWSAGGVVAYEIVQQLLAANEEIRGLVLFDSPCPIGLEALPSRLHEFFAEIGLLGDGKNVPDWLIPHFSASIRALSSYEPKPLPKSAKAPKTLAMWAKYGVCRYPGKDPRPERLSDEPKSMTWLLDNRTDFSSNGWDKLLGPDVIKTASVEGNHFDMMRKGEQVCHIAFAHDS
jgi:iterative type I PKS product template protein